MNRLSLTILLVMFAGAFTSLHAQAPEPDQAPPVAPGEPGETGEGGAAPKDEAPAPKVIPGDVLVLHNGTRMTGVQVLRATPQFYEVEVIEGVTVEVPRRGVKEVIHDDVDPARDRLRQELFPEQQEVTIESGERVTSALRDQLMAPVTVEPLSYRDRDFAEALEEIKTARGLNLRVHPSIRELPEQDRRWTVDVGPDRTLLAFLREDLMGAFEFVEVIFEADRIIVLTKDAAAIRASNQPTNAGVNPAAPPEPATAATPAPGPAQPE